MLLPARPRAAAARRVGGRQQFKAAARRHAPPRASAERAASAQPPPACDADWRTAVFSFWRERGGERDARSLVALAEETPSLRDPSALKRSVSTLEALLPGASVAAMVARHPPVRRRGRAGEHAAAA